MKQILDNLNKVRFLLEEDINKIVFIVFIFILASSLDLIGLGLVGAYLAMIVDPEYLFSRLPDYFIFDNLRLMDKSEMISFTGLILVVAFIFKVIATLVSNYIIYRFSVGRQFKLQKKLMDRFINQEYEIFIQRNSKEYISAVVSYARRYKDVLQAMLRMLSDFFVFCAVIITLLLVSYKTLLVLISLFLSLGVMWNLLFLRKVEGYGKLFHEGQEMMIKGVSEGISGLKEVKILGKENYFLSYFNKGIEIMASMEIKQMMISITPRSILELLMVVFVVLVVLLGMNTGNNLDELLVVLGVFAVGAARLVPITSQLLNSINIIKFGKDAVNRVYEDVKDAGEIRSKITSSDSAFKNKEFKSITIKELSYSYPSSELASLKEINLDIKKGEFIGLVGPSGSGKTTLVDILLGLLKPQKGRVELNDSDIQLGLNSWRSLIAYIPQDIFLIDDTLKANIMLGTPETKESEVRLNKALESSNLNEFINSLPDGLQTRLGERGIRFSGGQRQRVSIARAVFHQRDILILDEATSSLDSETEQSIVKQIQTFKGEKTIIAIAHRLSTLKNCDKLYLLKDGRISEEYSYEDYIKVYGEHGVKE
tara:strand:+ start:267 stop:2054 length:1788 start_codon:yes stop_codon:yes gene_type:complete